MHTNKTFCFYFVIFFLSAANPTLADGLRFYSSKYQYSFAVPTGWSQIPDHVIESWKKERLPPQGMNLIYETAFQRGFNGTWFEWPYVVVQVIPLVNSKVRRLPTEQELIQFAQTYTGGKAVERIRDAIASTPSAENRKLLESSIVSLSNTKVQINVPKRQYWFTIKIMDPTLGPIKGYIAGTFMKNGNVVQINAFSLASQFEHDIEQFLEISQSLHSTLSTTESQR